MDMKLRQYEQGKRFCDGVVARAGIDGLNRVWQNPLQMPSLAELDDPGRVARAHRGRRGLSRGSSSCHGYRPPVGHSSARRSERIPRAVRHTVGTGRTRVPDVTKFTLVYNVFTRNPDRRVTRRWSAVYKHVFDENDRSLLVLTSIH